MAFLYPDPDKLKIKPDAPCVLIIWKAEDIIAGSYLDSMPIGSSLDGTRSALFLDEMPIGSYKLFFVV